MISSCQDTGQEELTTQESLEDGKRKHLSDYEAKLRELTLFMGEVFQNPEARKELFELAKADEYEEDISYSLKKLLRTNENPVSRKRSAIVSAFFENAKNHRASGEPFDEKKLIDFINSNDISMLAPYMIGYFEPDKISELTVSWWTEEMEIEALKIDPNWKGETPGYKLKLYDDGNFISFGKNNSNPASELVYANDEYAKQNPTVVFGRFDDPDLLEKKVENISITSNLAISSVKIPCSAFFPGRRYTLSMPEWRLTQSVRSWPNNNFVHLWFVHGDISNLLNNQSPTLSNVIQTKPLSGYKILRRHANDGRWQGGPLLIHNFPSESLDFYLIWAVERPGTTFTMKGDVKVKKNEITIPLPEFTVSPPQMKLLGNSNLDSYMRFDKCFILDDNFNMVGNAFDGNGNLLTRTVGGDTYPVIRQNVAEFILRTIN